MGDNLETEDTQALLASFDRDLDDATRTEIADQLAMDHCDGWPAASEAQVQEFATSEWGGELVKSWGSRTAKHLGVAKREADSLMSRMGELQKFKLNEWINARTPVQRRRIVEALAARAVRKL